MLAVLFDTSTHRVFATALSKENLAFTSDISKTRQRLASSFGGCLIHYSIGGYLVFAQTSSADGTTKLTSGYHGNIVWLKV
jgi:hypothetical protein